MYVTMCVCVWCGVYLQDEGGVCVCVCGVVCVYVCVEDLGRACSVGQHGQVVVVAVVVMVAVVGMVVRWWWIEGKRREGGRRREEVHAELARADMMGAPGKSAAGSSP